MTADASFEVSLVHPHPRPPPRIRVSFSSPSLYNVAVPEPIDTEPELPELDVPELNTRRPVAPFEPAFAVRIEIAPLVDDAPAPVWIDK